MITNKTTWNNYQKNNLKQLKTKQHETITNKTTSRIRNDEQTMQIAFSKYPF